MKSAQCWCDALLPDNVRYIHTAYVVAGAHVGDNDSITSGLAQLHRPYDDLMQQVTEASGTHTFPCLIAVRIAYATALPVATILLLTSLR